VLTDQRPLPGADAHAVRRAGRELGPVGELAVVLAGQLAALSDGRHGLGGAQALAHVGLRAVQLAAGHSWRVQRDNGSARLHQAVKWSRLLFVSTDGTGCRSSY